MWKGTNTKHSSFQNRLIKNNLLAQLEEFGRMRPVIVVHGGAGRIFKEREEGCRTGVVRAALRGYGVLKQGGSALDAVEEAVRSMEDDPHFNAGNFERIKCIYNHYVCWALDSDHCENTGLHSPWIMHIVVK